MSLNEDMPDQWQELWDALMNGQGSSQDSSRRNLRALYAALRAERREDKRDCWAGGNLWQGKCISDPEEGLQKAFDRLKQFTDDHVGVNKDLLEAYVANSFYREWSKAVETGESSEQLSVLSKYGQYSDIMSTNQYVGEVWFPEGVVDYKSSALNGDGVEETYAVDADGNPHTVYLPSNNNDAVSTSYEDFLAQGDGTGGDTETREKADQYANDLNETLGGIVDEQVLSDALYNSFAPGGPMPEATGPGPTITVDIWDCLNQPTKTWDECTTLGVVLQLPGLPELPSAVLGTIFKDVTLKEIKDIIVDTGTTIKNVITGECAPESKITDPDTDEKRCPTIVDIVLGKIEEKTDELGDIFDQNCDTFTGTGCGITPEDVIKTVGGGISQAVWGIILTGAGDKVRSTIGFPIIGVGEDTTCTDGTVYDSAANNGVGGCVPSGTTSGHGMCDELDDLGNQVEKLDADGTNCPGISPDWNPGDPCTTGLDPDVENDGKLNDAGKCIPNPVTPPEDPEDPRCKNPKFAYSDEGRRICNTPFTEDPPRPTKCEDRYAVNYDQEGECGDCRGGYTRKEGATTCSQDNGDTGGGDTTTTTAVYKPNCNEARPTGLLTFQLEQQQALWDGECGGTTVGGDPVTTTGGDLECSQITADNYQECKYIDCFTNDTPGPYKKTFAECPSGDGGGDVVIDDGECPPKGTVLESGCDGTTFFIRFADGACEETYDSVPNYGGCSGGTGTDPCLSADYAAMNPEECSECIDCSCPEYAAANPEECTTGPEPPSGGGGGGGGGGDGGGGGSSGMFDLESFEIAGDPQLLARMEFPITNFLEGMFKDYV